MTSTADIIRQLMIDIGVVEESGTWSAFVGMLPESPDSAVCVYDTAGVLDGRKMVDGEQIVHHGVEIRVRGTSYPITWGKAYEIALALDEQARTEVVIDSDETYTVLNVSRTGDILPIGMEEEGGKRRHHFTVNAVVSTEVTT